MNNIIHFKMNLEYLEPVQYIYPQTLNNIFDCKSHALVCAFNRLGKLRNVKFIIITIHGYL